MLLRLAILAGEVDPSQLKKICKEIIAISHYNPFEYVNNYFGVLFLSLECRELEMTEQLLQLLEGLPETQMQR